MNGCRLESNCPLVGSGSIRGLPSVGVFRPRKNVISGKAIKGSPYETLPSIILLEYCVSNVLQQVQNNKLHNVCDVAVYFYNR